MTRYLVDTNVISVTAPTTAVRRPELIEWMDLHSPDDGKTNLTLANNLAVRRALEAAGVEFTNGDQPGVKLALSTA